MCSYKLKQKRQLRRGEASAEPDKHRECHKSNVAVPDVNSTSCRLTQSHKRKSSYDVHPDDAAPGKKLKFSSIFTNNPEIPHVDR